ncbi:MAG: DUF1559 domain-containing protein, partial [Planctomycetes bacterium]|nr:DUF1559 domain-containing protein [Planctomycetota bacterium]
RPQTVDSHSWDWPAYLALLVLAGLIAGFVRLLLGIWAVRSYRRQATPLTNSSIQEMADVLLAEMRGPRAVTVCESKILSTPATVGWSNPLIILPLDWRDWTDDECRAVLAHEIAHITRHDYATWLAAQLALVIHFYHPLIHWLAARLRLEQELAADAAAAQIMGGQRLYLTTLAEMALRRSDQPLAWPARTFLPTRGTLMRRIEMLRDEKLRTEHLTRRLRTGIVLGLAVVAVALAGLRGAAADPQSGSPTAGKSASRSKAGSPELAQDSSRPPATPARISGIGAGGAGLAGAAPTIGQTDPESLAWIPRDAQAVVRIKPHELLSRPAMAAVKKLLQDQKLFEAGLGVPLTQIDQLTIPFTQEVQAQFQSLEPLAGMIRLVPDANPTAVLRALIAEPYEQEFAGQKYLKSKTDDQKVVFQADARTFVVSHREDYLRRVLVAGRGGAAKAPWAQTWRDSASTDLVAFVDIPRFRPALDQALAGPGETGPLAVFAPLWRDATTGLFTLHFARQLEATLELTAADAAAAGRVSQTLSALTTLSRNGLSQAKTQSSRGPAESAELLLRALESADDLLDSLRITQADRKLIATATLDAEATSTALSLVGPVLSAAREAAQQPVAANNLKQLALAMHNYESAHGSFPPAVLYGPDGKTPYSWRVALLPFVGEAALYEEYRQTESWDSPHNKALLERMPAVYRDPTMGPQSSNSSYYVLTGPSTIFSGKKGTRLAEITDGTSNTILVVEAKRDIPWTKPEDIPVEPNQPLPKLGGYRPNIFQVSLADGSVRAFPETLQVPLFQALASKAGGEVINWNEIVPAKP